MTKVLCLGAFDDLADGHRRFIEEAKRQGDYLVAIVFHDDFSYEWHGKKPIKRQYHRAMSLEELRLVDEIVIVPKDFNETITTIKTIKPEIIALGADQIPELKRTLEKYLESCDMHPRYYVSEEIAEGIRVD